MSGPVRSLLLAASTNPFLAEKLPRMGFVRRAARRFMPGEEIDDALAAAETLQEAGAPTLVTLLGENVEDPGDARAVVEHYVDAIDRIARRSLDTELSVKLTQLGLDLGEEAATANVVEVVRAAAASRRMVWIDMESSGYVDATLAVFRAARAEHDNVGICLQAYLYRSHDDLAGLLPLNPAVRLVKGAYRESDEVAYPRKGDVDTNYLKLAMTLLKARAGGRAGRPAIATHDLRIVRDVVAMAERHGVAPDDWEVEMLYGIAERDQRRLLEEGVPLRVLISYGDHWFPWYMRRLAERPANLWFVVRKMVGL